ncbi:hypothetical protein [Novipirellula artificiosorum]|uniref:Uncharacterized protein n=1 Tax=Novipirellula artificiosorum TaxID=2528016 RepID=A0A5C6CWL3_9BACT|nr:hypothetical protein [Novipirellula artificiosorum]TWU27937.1 hypothetical protein Poly41_70110 [Novipirellula artificiosorum]
MNRNSLRYSIAFLLFLCLCVAGFLAGYRAGYPNGYASGKAKRQAEEPYPEVYQIGDLIRATGDGTHKNGDPLDYQSLLEATRASVFPTEWQDLGGRCSMAPVPSLESLVVNATSGVHDRIQAFFGDLSSVKRAVAESKEEQESMQRARDEWLSGVLEPVSKSLGKELKLIEAGIDLVGSWDVQQTTPDGSVTSLRYTFVDTDTVRIPSPDDAGKSMETWYFISAGSVVVAGKAYLAATTADDNLVLIPNNDPQTFLVASQANDEP